MRILKALLKPRPLIGIACLVISVWAAGMDGVSLWWSVPAGLWWADTLGTIYTTIKKEMA